MTDVSSFPMYIEHPGDVSDHPLVLALGDGERLGALGLYGVVGSWAIRYTQDGTVPASVVNMHDGRGRIASALVAAGLWHYDDNRNTYRFAHWQRPAAESNGHPG